MKTKLLAVLFLVGTCSAQITNPSSSSSGTVTSMSSGNLVPLFTTSVATSTSTPALSFSLTNAAAGTLFGNSSGSSGAPSYTATPTLGVAGTAGTLSFAGLTSGTCTVGADATGANHTIACGIQLTGASGAATTISTSTSNANLILAPNGTGAVVAPAGAVTQAALVFNGDTTGGLYRVGANAPCITNGTNCLFYFNSGAVTYQMGASAAIAWTSSADAAGTKDTCIDRAKAKVVRLDSDSACGNGLGFRVDGNKTFVTADFTTAASTSLQTITGLTWTLPVSLAVNYSFHCSFNYSIATANVAVAFGVQGATTAPTSITAHGTIWTANTAGALTPGQLTALNTTTATNVMSATPTASVTTIMNADMDGTIEAPSNATPTVFNVMVSTANASDLVTVKRGSYCAIY